MRTNKREAQQLFLSRVLTQYVPKLQIVCRLIDKKFGRIAIGIELGAKPPFISTEVFDEIAFKPGNPATAFRITVDAPGV